MKKKNKDLLVVVTGLVLIIIVAAFSVFRASEDSNKKSPLIAPEEVKSKYEIISVPELLQKISKGDGVTIIDTRSFESYSIEHILDSISIPLNEIDLTNEKFGPQVYIFTDSSDQIALNDASAKLQQKGAKEIIFIDGNITSWKNSGGQVVVYGNPTSFIDQSKVSYLSREDLGKKLSENEPLFILDVREKEAFSKGHLSGAVNIPLPEIEKRRSEISTSKEIVIYANGEIESFQAAVRLYDIKFMPSSILKEGFSGWTKNLFPVTQ